MVNFIESLVIKFNKLTIDFFIRKYNLHCIKNIQHVNEKSIFIYKNSFVINNKILNLQYNSNLDENKYSLVYMLYRNISYNYINKNQNELKCYLDFETKDKIHKNYTNICNDILSNDILSNDILIIGRKYLHKNKIDKNLNSLGIFCKYTIESYGKKFDNVKKIRKTNGVSKRISKLVDHKSKNLYNSYLRRTFLFNLKSELYNTGSFDSTLYTNNILKSSLFLDVEYINDIYDDFETFPISKDSTLLFMIGYSFIDKSKKSLEYKNFIVKKLNILNEYELLNDFLNDIIKKYNETKIPIVIFHWSHADKSIIEKSLKRHPDLYNKYQNEVVIKYIDLLLIFKKTIFFESYSLKFIAKNLLNITYDTECKNGFDAMCSIIQNNCILEKSKQYNKLIDFSSTNDIIKYNRMDTELLYILLKKIIS